MFVDGLDVRDLPLARLRGAIGFVPQEPFLFSDTLADNVAFGLDARRPGTGDGDAQAARQQRIVDAAAVARLDKDVADFPKGYDTTVGERGITLSGRTEAAHRDRARGRDRPAHPDPGRRAVGSRHLHRGGNPVAAARRHARSAPSIIVSHRISTVRDADQILVLDKGRIVERGTHDELFGDSGLYADLHRKQLLEEELAAS